MPVSLLRCGRGGPADRGVVVMANEAVVKGAIPFRAASDQSPAAVAHYVPPQQAGGPSAVAWPRRDDQSSPSSPHLLPRLLHDDATVFVVFVVGPCC
jgi:hypothetical protein